MLLRAHFDNALDLGKVDIFDPKCVTRLKFVITEYERRTAQKLNEYDYLLNVILTDTSPDPNNSEVERLLQELTANLVPWAATGKEELTKLVKDMKQQWVDVWGDPDDPEVKKKIDETVAYMNRGNK